MFGKRIGTALVILGLSAAAVPASATVMIATFQGTVLYGFDATGEFGQAQTDLTHMSYVATFTYDTALAQLAYDGPLGQYTYGGTNPNYAGASVSPYLDATFTLGGVTKDFGPGGYEMALEAANFGTMGLFWNHVVDTETTATQTSYSYLDNTLYSLDVPKSFTTPFTGTPSGGSSNFTSGAMLIQVDEAGVGRTHDAYAYLTPLSVTVAAAGAVPEPQTWALLLAGFFGVGTVLRRSREKAVEA